MADASTTQDSPFWRFSLGFYRQPGVSDACIELQDQAGVDVNIMLFLLWNATLNRTLPKPMVEQLEAKIGPLREATVIPLRTLRRALRIPPPAVEPGAAEAFRTHVKRVELEAERLQQQTMYELVSTLAFDSTSAPGEAARASIAAYQAICPRPFPPAAADTILAAFDRRSPASAMS
jgi:uncharacterized protein (TIGR02444 family)